MPINRSSSCSVLRPDLIVHGRLLLVHRVIVEEWAVVQRWGSFVSVLTGG